MIYNQPREEEFVISQRAPLALYCVPCCGKGLYALGPEGPEEDADGDSASQLQKAEGTGLSHWADQFRAQQKVPQVDYRTWQPSGMPVLPTEGLSLTEEKSPSNSTQHMDIKNP